MASSTRARTVSVVYTAPPSRKSKCFSVLANYGMFAGPYREQNTDESSCLRIQDLGPSTPSTCLLRVRVNRLATIALALLAWATWWSANRSAGFSLSSHARKQS